jgi:(-)-germacrene D synthase
VKQHVQIIKEVKNIFLSSKNDIGQQLNLIDSLQRLGISYHFESEIDEALEQIHNNFTNNKEGDLHFLALAFRLLRQKGHRISSGRYIVIFLAYFVFCFKELAKFGHTSCTKAIFWPKHPR